MPANEAGPIVLAEQNDRSCSACARVAAEAFLPVAVRSHDGRFFAIRSTWKLAGLMSDDATVTTRLLLVVADGVRPDVLTTRFAARVSEVEPDRAVLRWGGSFAATLAYDSTQSWNLRTSWASVSTPSFSKIRERCLAAVWKVISKWTASCLMVRPSSSCRKTCRSLGVSMASRACLAWSCCMH